MKTIRPESLNEFVGQANARRILTVLITAAKRRNEPVPHVLMNGPPGLGKTTLARIIATEMGGRLIEVIGSAVKTPSEMSQHLMQLKSHDVLFIDEIHALPRRLEELLYPAMEDLMVNVTEKNFDELMKQLSIRQSDKTTSRRQLPPFTLIGATTLLGLTSAPLRSRFRQIIELETYSDSDLQIIIGNAASKLDFPLQPDIIHEIAVRSRATA
jgi:Holliday junction DNA helicase RuvB